MAAEGCEFIYIKVGGGLCKVMSGGAFCGEAVSGSTHQKKEARVDIFSITGLSKGQSSTTLCLD